MSDDIIQELKMDLSREKEKIFLQKHLYNIIILIGVILLAIAGYQYYQAKQTNALDSAATDYYNFTQFYNNIENLTDLTTKSPKLLPETIDSVPSYFAMSTLIKFNTAQKKDASNKELLKITTDYLKNPQQKPLSVHDSLLKLFNLSLKSDKIDFKRLESEFNDYLKHPFAFKTIAYETLFFNALDAKNATQAQHYLTQLQANATPQEKGKIKIYQTHPLLQQNIIASKKSVPNNSSAKNTTQAQ